MKSEHLRWACRRGMLELDMLLGPYFDKHFEKLTARQQQTFEELLKESDADLFNWFIGFSEPQTDAMRAMIKLIKDAKLHEYKS